MVAVLASEEVSRYPNRNPSLCHVVTFACHFPAGWRTPYSNLSMSSVRRARELRIIATNYAFHLRLPRAPDRRLVCMYCSLVATPTDVFRASDRALLSGNGCDTYLSQTTISEDPISRSTEQFRMILVSFVKSKAPNFTFQTRPTSSRTARYIVR